MIYYKDGYKYVDGVKIPKVRKTSMEFREKWNKNNIQIFNKKMSL